MKKLLSSVVLSTALFSSAHAGALVDISVGGGYFPTMEPTGKIGDSATSAFDLVANLGLEKSSQTYLYADFNHLIPVIPNIRYEQSTLDFTGTASQTVSFGGVSITASSPSEFSMSNADYILYYGVPFSTWLPMIDVADFGIGVKAGTLSAGIQGVSSGTLDFYLPYGYGRLHITPPFLLGIGFEAEIKYISYGGASFAENIYKADWSIEAPLPVIELEVGVEAGYKSTALMLDVSGGYMDLSFAGVFFGVFGHFGI